MGQKPVGLRVVAHTLQTGKRVGRGSLATWALWFPSSTCHAIHSVQETLSERTPDSGLHQALACGWQWSHGVLRTLLLFSRRRHVCKKLRLPWLETASVWSLSNRGGWVLPTEARASPLGLQIIVRAPDWLNMQTFNVLHFAVNCVCVWGGCLNGSRFKIMMVKVMFKQCCV